MFFHYWCAASAEVAADASSPVMLWYNGGPGASSLFGMLQEFGPLLLTAESYDDAHSKTGVPTPQANPYAWTRFATVCAIDSPPPMGLSYCTAEGPSAGPRSCGAWRDSSVAAANRAAYGALVRDAFPEWTKATPLGKPTFVVGESYAGIYVPTFVSKLMDSPVDGLALQGFAVGDGMTGCSPSDGKPPDYCVNLTNVGLFAYPNSLPGPRYDVEFFHGHSQFSERTYRDILNACTDAELDGEDLPLSVECAAAVARMSEEVGSFYPYQLLQACPSPKAVGAAHVDRHGANMALRVRKLQRTTAGARAAHAARVSPGDGDGGVGSPCLADAMPDWLLLEKTLAAIGAPANSSFNNVDNGIGFDYTTDQTFVGPIYKRALAKGLRVLVYEGDSDACGLETAPNEDTFVKYFDEIGLQQTRPWRPWRTLDGVAQAGYSMGWSNDQALFASIRGAGHLVPLDRPAAAYALMSGFILDKQGVGATATGPAELR